MTTAFRTETPSFTYNYYKHIQSLHSNTAILIFSRFALEEAEAKGYANYVGYKGGIALAKHLINYTLDEARRSGISVHTCFSDQQSGNTFGEKLANAIESIYERGFENVIVLGTDSPSITAALIERVANQLASSKLVLGPAKDGGVYLIGINKAAYTRERFISLPWLSPVVYQSLLQYACIGHLQTVIELEGEDFDEISCILDWKIRHAQNILSQVIDLLITAFRKVQGNIVRPSTLHSSYSGNIHFRGPPTHFSIQP